MTNNTPISNSLNIRISHILEDILTVGGDDGVTAATNGNAFTAKMRNEKLTEACGYLGQALFAAFGAYGAIKACEGLMATQSVTFYSSGVALNKDFIAPVRLVKSDGSVYKYGLKNEWDADDQFFLNNTYAIEGNKIYAYERSAGTLTLLNSGTGTFYYVKHDRMDTSTGTTVVVNTTPDTTINAQWHEFLIAYAAARLAQDKGAGEWTEKVQTLMSQAMALIPKSQ